MKVKFKPEVRELLESKIKYSSSGWVNVNINNSMQSYCKEFLDTDWFEVSKNPYKEVCSIIAPIYLSKYVINEKHIQPYNQFNITIEDELFEL